MWQINNLSFGYDKNYLFKDVNITIKENKIGLVGKNGVGKTTLLNILAKNIKISQGSIELKGETYFTTYDFSKYSKFTINDFLLLIKPLKSFSYSKVDYYLKLLDINEYKEAQLGTLSKGTLKKVGILLTFLSNREILLIDEPFESIDEDTNNNIIDEMLRIDKKYMVVSHDFDYLKRVCDKIYYINNKGIEAYDR